MECGKPCSYHPIDSMQSPTERTSLKPFFVYSFRPSTGASNVCEAKTKDIEIQPGFEPWSSEFLSGALTN